MNTSKLKYQTVWKYPESLQILLEQKI